MHWLQIWHGIVNYMLHFVLLVRILPEYFGQLYWHNVTVDCWYWFPPPPSPLLHVSAPLPSNTDYQGQALHFLGGLVVIWCPLLWNDHWTGRRLQELPCLLMELCTVCALKKWWCLWEYIFKLIWLWSSFAANWKAASENQKFTFEIKGFLWRALGLYVELCLWIFQSFI